MSSISWSYLNISDHYLCSAGSEATPCINITRILSVTAEHNRPYKLVDIAVLKDVKDEEDVKAVAAHPRGNGTARTIVTCDYKKEKYECANNQEDMNDVKIDNCSMTVQTSNVSGSIHINATLTIAKASEGQPRQFCFVYHFERNGNLRYQSTLFNVNFNTTGGERHILS